MGKNHASSKRRRTPFPPGKTNPSLIVLRTWKENKASANRGGKKAACKRQEKGDKKIKKSTGKNARPKDQGGKQMGILNQKGHSPSQKNWDQKGGGSYYSFFVHMQRNQKMRGIAISS